MKRLFTKGGKYGDILWSLIAARRWSRDVGEPVDFCCMTACRMILDLIRQQPYIRNALHDPNWTGGCVSTLTGYDDVRNGSYSRPPDRHLAHFIASLTNLTLTDEDQTPWIAYNDVFPKQNFIAYGWNELYADRKAQFMRELTAAMPGVTFLNCSVVPWADVGQVIAKAKAFLGCRNSLFVVANGVGQKNIITYEPEPCRMNAMFSCPWGPERNVTVWQHAYEILKDL